jgi:hypothetical protein
MDVTGGWRRLHDEKLYNLYPSPDIIIIKLVTSRMVGLAAREAHMEDIKNAYKISV